MNNIGNYLLLISFSLTLLSVVFLFLNKDFKSIKLLIQLKSYAIILSIFCLGYLFVTNDYSNQYVWQTSNISMPVLYKITAIWGGMDGSMLLWTTLLCFFNLIFLYGTKEDNRFNRVSLTFSTIGCLFFIFVTCFFTNPFKFILSDFIPNDGNGLNPLLQNIYMAIHPPTLYLGFTAFLIPSALAVGAFITGQSWIARGRNWLISAWILLTIGITLGGFWAYLELGWGGFWAWDPVENSSFFPWLTSTALIHSIIAEEKKKVFVYWNIFLAFFTYFLTIFGTFLTRSGVVESVHAFASSSISFLFGIYLILLLIFYVFVFIKKYKKSDKIKFNYISRETFFLLNNYIFVVILIATIWGVIFPPLSELLTSSRQSVGIPYFNLVNRPIFILMLFLMSFALIVKWQKDSLINLCSKTKYYLLISILILLSLVWLKDITALIIYLISIFGIVSIVGQLFKLNSFSFKKISAYTAHFGVFLVAIAITSSMFFKVEKEFALSVGEEIEISDQIVKLKKVEDFVYPNYSSLYAEVDIESSFGNFTLKPEHRFYFKNKETTTEVAIKPSLTKDLYLVLAGTDDGSKFVFKIFINPLQSWLWLGVFIIVLGGIFSLGKKYSD